VIGVEGIEHDVGANDERVSQGMVAEESCVQPRGKAGYRGNVPVRPQSNKFYMSKGQGHRFSNLFVSMCTNGIDNPPCQPGTKDGVAQLSRQQDVLRFLIINNRT